MIYIVEESYDYYADKGYHVTYAAKTIEGARTAVANFIKSNGDEELYDFGYDEEDKIWWCSTSRRNFQIICLPLND